MATHAAIRDTTEHVHTFEQSDGHLTHYRLWGAPQGNDVIVMLHGGMSHSGWQAPLAEAIGAASGVSFVAMDRRGSGLNDQRGHLESPDRAVDDVEELLRHLAASYERVHLAGWCFGGQVASSVAAQVAGKGVISTLLLLAPGFHFNERYSDVLRLSMEAAFAVVEEFGLEPEPTRPYLQVPLQPSDFTDLPEWQAFVEQDELRLTRVTKGMVEAWGALAQRAEPDFARIGDVPVLAVFGRKDRLVDNERVHDFLTGLKPLQVEWLDTGHALHFEEVTKLTGLITEFLARHR
ncbi:alpha/beta fold hydrolase [Streptomyces sp. bgisy100]|uniref:alpha/beta fold hydrolase n=1 Tax=Streptomyces sp. bgisy100 TaxID=3413783 RepID=UPI003D76227B